MVLWRFLTIVFLTVLIVHIAPVNAQQMASIPLDGQRIPSDDLEYNGRLLRADEAYRLAQEGLDLSALDPVESALWDGQDYIPSTRTDSVDVHDGDEVVYAGALLSASGMFRFNAQVGSTTAIVHLDKTLHTTLLRKNILRLLGYKIPAIKWIRRLHVSFATEDEMKAFLDSQIPRATLGASSRWVEKKDESGLVVTLHDVAVTVPDSSDHYNLAMGVPPQTLTNRTLRSLIIPYALTELGESANKFEWYVGQKDNNSIHLPHFTRGIFTTTIDDARWALRRLGQLTRDDFRQAVELAYYPKEVTALLVEKLISRRNSLIEIFAEPMSKMDINPEVNLGEFLKKGKIEKEDWQGYASRFAHGDPESPFKDLHWFALSKIQAFALDNLVSRVNQELVIFNPEKVRSKFHADQFKKGLDHYVETGYLLDFPIGAWVSPLGNIGLVASRDVVVGNYLGTDNLVQLADSIGFNIQMGVQVGIENIDIMPTLALKASAGYSKIWTHLKPLSGLKQVFQEPYQNIVVPLIKWQLAKRIKRLSELGNSENPQVDWNLDEDNSALAEIVRHINEKLGVGESIIYTERITGSAGASGGTTIMGTPLHLSVSGSVDDVTIRRIQIYRKSKNILQVYDDFGNGKGWSVNVSLQRFIPIIQMGWRRQKGDYSVRLHEVDLNPDVAENPRLFDKASALANFLQTGSAELLEEIKKPHVVETDFNDKSSKFAFLFWRHRKLRSDATFHIEASEGLNGNYVALTDEKQSGLNWEAFVKDIINYGFQRLSAGVDWASPMWQNPAQTIGGMGTTTSVRFESRVKDDGVYDERFMRLTDRWEGWSKKVKKLKKRLAAMNEKFGFNLFDERSLENIEKLKLFDIAVNLNLYEEGIQKLTRVHPNSLIMFEYQYEEASGIRKTGCDGDENRIRRRETSNGRIIETCGTLNTVIAQNDKCRKWAAKGKKDQKEMTKCYMRLFRDLYEDLEYKEVAMLLGNDNVFVHGTINGFRDGDEILNDSISSNTSGRVGGRFWNGPFDKIQQMLGIQAGELNGHWLRERL